MSKEDETPTPPPASVSSPSTTWKLPDGIEDRLEEGIFNAAIGVTVGGIVGMMLFKSGRGWRSASIATGLGVALGSTGTRIFACNTSKSSTSPEQPAASSNANDATTNGSPPTTSMIRVQKFQTDPPVFLPTTTVTRKDASSP